MIKNGRELTCKGVYHVMDEIKNVCLTQEENYNYVRLMIDAYNKIRDNSPIGCDENEDYPSLVVLGNDDGSKAYIDEDGLIHHREEDWRVIEYHGFCIIDYNQMDAMFPKEFGQFYEAGFTLDDILKGFNVYTCKDGKRFFELCD